MQYQIGKHYAVSDTIKGYLASRNIDFLKQTKQFYNYDNKLDILAQKLDRGTATQQDKQYVSQLLANVKKMNKAQRAKVAGGYETLLTNVQLLSKAYDDHVKEPQLDKYVQRHFAKEYGAASRHIERKLQKLEDAANKGYLSIHQHLPQLTTLHDAAYRIGNEKLARRITKLGVSIADYEGSVRRATGLKVIASNNYLTLGQRVQALNLLRHEGRLDELVRQDPKALGAIKSDVYARNDQFLTDKFNRITKPYNKIKEPGARRSIKHGIAAGLLTALLSLGSCGKGEEDKKQDAPTPQVVAYTDKSARPDASKPDVSQLTTPSRADDPGRKPMDTGSGTGTEPKKKMQEEPGKQQYDLPQHSDASVEDVWRFISKAEYFGSSDFNRGTLNAKALFDLGKGFGADITGQLSRQGQEFENGTLEGKIVRGGLGLYKYFGLNDRELLYARAAAIHEDRNFTFKPELGTDLDFGNNAWNVVGQLGYAKDGDFKDEPLFDDSFTKLLLTLSYGSGDMTGDIEGSYRSLRATVLGQQYLGETGLGKWYVEGGLGYQKEDLGKDWNQRILSGELGVKVLDGHWMGRTGMTWRDLESEMSGANSERSHPGFKAGIGYMPDDWIEFVLDGGYEWDDGSKDGLGGYGMLSIKLNLPSRRRK